MFTVKTNTEQPEGSKATSNDGTEQTPTEQEKTTQEVCGPYHISGCQVLQKL